MADARELAWATDDPLDPQKGWGGGRQPTRLKHARARFLWSVRISKSPTREGVRIGLMEDMFFAQKPDPQRHYHLVAGRCACEGSLGGKAQANELKI